MENVNISLENLLGVLSLFTALLYFFQLLIVKKLSEQSSKLILFYFGMIAFIIFFFEAFDNGFEHISKPLIPLLNFSALAIAPTIYLYIKSIISINKVDRLVAHYYPAIAVGIVSLALHFAPPENAFTKQSYIYLTVTNLTVGFILINGYYIFLSLRIYKEHLSSIENIFSYEENVKLEWIKILLFGFILFVAGLVIVSLIDDKFGEIIFDLLMLSYIAYTGYHAVKQSNIYSAVSFDEKLIAQAGAVEPTESIDVTPNIKLDELKQKIVALVESEKLFLRQDITIFDIAEQLDSNSKYVSQAINGYLNKSFIVFINEYRVEASKGFLIDSKNDNFTIEGIGQMAGFKSKSAFNTAFKKITGVTPSIYKKEMLLGTLQ